MIEFAQPIWLWAMTGIAVPVIIHLWNIRPGRTLQVGSIMLLAETTRSHSRSLRLSELLLLLLRCLLLMLLALIISKPMLLTQTSPVEKGWVVIEPQGMQMAYEKFGGTIDSLLKAGYTLHYFTSGFETAKLDMARRPLHSETVVSSQPYWNLVKALNQRVPDSLPVYLFTDNRLARFVNRRPSVSMNLHWLTWHAVDTPATWLARAFGIAGDSIRLLTGISNHASTYYSGSTISLHSPGANFAINAKDGKTRISVKSYQTGINNDVAVDTVTLTACIYSEKRGADAGYLLAALNALRDFTHHKIRATVVHAIENIPKNAEWLFWLSETAIAPNLVKRHVFLYEKGNTQEMNSVIETGNSLPVDEVPLFKMIVNRDAPAGYAVWKNGFGRTVLSREQRNGDIFHFFSRFDPQWNGLPWSGQFPQVIYQLLYPDTGNTSAIVNDRRSIDEKQVLPAIAKGTELLPKLAATQKTDLTKIFWIMAFLLFITERMITFAQKKEAANG